MPQIDPTKQDVIIPQIDSLSFEWKKEKDDRIEELKSELARLQKKIDEKDKQIEGMIEDNTEQMKAQMMLNIGLANELRVTREKDEAKKLLLDSIQQEKPKQKAWWRFGL